MDGVSEARDGGNVAALITPHSIPSVGGEGPAHATRNNEIPNSVQNLCTEHLMTFNGEIGIQAHLYNLHLELEVNLNKTRYFAQHAKSLSNVILRYAAPNILVKQR